MESNYSSWVRTIQLPKSSLNDNRADVDRLIQALKDDLHINAISLDLNLYRRVPDILRQHNYHIRCVVFGDHITCKVIDLCGHDSSWPCTGIAVDLGTSRIVMRLINLDTRDHLKEISFTNPQRKYGADILTRLHYAEQENGLEQLHGCLIEALNEGIQTLCQSQGLAIEHVYAFTLAGNTAMTHLFLCLNTRFIIREPYIPVVNVPELIKASDIGIHIHPYGHIYVFPNVGSYFGGDLIAGILYSGLYQREDPTFLVDVGTNAEVVLGNTMWMIACAGAAGPALEGGISKIGSMAGPGVIDQVKILRDTHTGLMDIVYHCIDDLPPIGICGSGLIDLAAQLFQAGLIDQRGKFRPDACGNRLIEEDGMFSFVLVSQHEHPTGQSLEISQAELDSLIRSKAAMYTILETISLNVGISLNEISKFYIAGTFGAFIRPESAITIGMIPDLDLSCYQAIGNSSLSGASLFLESFEYISQIQSIRDRITYMELNVNQEFMNRFSAAKFLPHTDPSIFPNVYIPKQ
ncbi:MAG: DUF4445 domain-containing protein [Desulfobacterales bacterium]|nr:DUF4445 domain-containing protein [Desulfobacterales bacterium]